MAKIDSLYQKKVKEHLNNSAEVKRATIEKCTASILRAAQLIVDTFTSGGKLLLCGNGGSAADCQHMAAELVCLVDKTFDRPALPAISLVTDTSFLTAYTNDKRDFKSVFTRQVQAIGKGGDTLIGISTSGKSQNIVSAVKTANTKNMHTIVLTGSDGELQELADIAICVPSTNTAYIQESHIAIEHILCELVEYYIFGEKGNRREKIYDHK